MDSIVEQIAKEVMMKLRDSNTNRGSAYTPPRSSASQQYPQATVSGKTAYVLTGNFKVIDQVAEQTANLLQRGETLIISNYVEDCYGQKLAASGCKILNYKNTSSNVALQGISKLIIPSLSVNTLSKAANLISDTFITRVLCHALDEGVRITITDPAIIEAARYFPAGLAEKINSFRRDLEKMGVIFERCAKLNVTPQHKCTTCISGTENNCISCNPAAPSQTAAYAPALPAYSNAPATAPLSKFRELLPPLKTHFERNQEIQEQTQLRVRTPDACLQDNCTRPYGSCAANCTNRVMDVISAGADRIEKGLDGALPPAQLAKFIDHTLLKANATDEEITKLCEEARQYSFASVCVNPGRVALAAKLLAGSPVKVCTVIGFPLGANSTFVKEMETRDAVANGAREIDMVINVGALKSKNYEAVKNDIARVVEAAGGNIVKVIIEASLLTDEEKVKACELSKLAGADFVKTSTGFSTGGATAEDVKLMRETVGNSMGVKASGGIRDTKTALEMIKSGASRVGASASVAIVKGITSDDSKGY